ncbi:uncharacterized protein PGTG_14549 [Puccinia graminis f. sp. tritici CRL 75-36-700-3]|uniref:Uncharacterized protein n=1 Tax=Puccinia graminis f. sp. tritici (strain CRL 75-36-700-3 / race SCCL) TaxID=418459 RepID=E3KU59_PUCGT|nr:uncharacterized protein PGTG_14549 [Puccinia graminis f. sp. tritici CRL 75-36-700-3]EFP87834.2 hypothetical protein PGTG_14549 [Puccinia graminis f. sp. tritici CRL 75-36-700-3]
MRDIAARYVSKATQQLGQHEHHQRPSRPRACKSAASGKVISSASSKSAPRTTLSSNRVSGKVTSTVSTKAAAEDIPSKQHSQKKLSARNPETSTTTKSKSSSSNHQSKSPASRPKNPLSSKRVLHQSSNTDSMDEQESGIEDCVEYESASESSESVSSAQPALANKSRVAGKSAAPPNPPESDWHSNPNVPGIRKVGPGGLNQNPSLKQKPKVSFDYSNIERSRQNSSSNKTSAASRSHTNSRTHPSDSQSTSLTPNPANHSSHSQRTLPAVYPGTYPFDGRRNFPIKNPGTNHSDGRPTSTNNRIVPDSFIRSSDPGHHSHEGATSNRGVTPPRTGSGHNHSHKIAAFNEGANHRTLNRDESKFSNPIDQLSASECMVLSNLLNHRLKTFDRHASINPAEDMPRAFSSKPAPTYYPPMESDSERLWFTLSSRIAKQEEQIIHTLIPHRDAAPWLPVTDYQATQEELAAGYPKDPSIIAPKWITLTKHHQPAAPSAELPPLLSHNAGNTLPAPPLSNMSDSDKILQLLQQMTAVQHQAFSYLARPPEKQAGALSSSTHLVPAQSASFSHHVGSPQNQAGASSSSAPPHHTQFAATAVPNLSKVSPSGLSTPLMFSPLVLNYPNSSSESTITNFQPPAPVQHDNQSVNPTVNAFTFVPTNATAGTCPAIPSIAVLPPQASSAVDLQHLPMSSRPIASPKQLRPHQSADVTGSNYQDSIENKPKPPSEPIIKNQKMTVLPESLDNPDLSTQPDTRRSNAQKQSPPELSESPNNPGLSIRHDAAHSTTKIYPQVALNSQASEYTAGQQSDEMGLTNDAPPIPSQKTEPPKPSAPTTATGANNPPKISPAETGPLKPSTLATIPSGSNDAPELPTETHASVMLGLSAAMADFVVEGKKFKEELPKSN